MPHLSLVKPEQLCLECNHGLIQYRTPILYHRPVQEGAKFRMACEEMIEKTYFVCEACCRCFIAQDQFSADFVELLVEGIYGITTLDERLLLLVKGGAPYTDDMSIVVFKKNKVNPGTRPPAEVPAESRR